MEIDGESRAVLTPDINEEKIAAFGSEEEKELESIMIARAAESEEKRAQLDDFNKLLQFKRDDGISVLSRL